MVSDSRDGDTGQHFGSFRMLKLLLLLANSETRGDVIRRRADSGKARTIDDDDEYEEELDNDDYVDDHRCC